MNKRKSKNCLICGKEFYKARTMGSMMWNRQKYCSLDCYHKSRIGLKATDIHKKHLSESRTGSKNWRWKGGKSRNFDKLIRQSYKYRQWRSDIFTRDDFTCQKCSSSNKGILEAHHIISFYKIITKYNIKTIEEAMNCEELWNINNGQTLCKECHKKTDNYGTKSSKKEPCPL